MALSGIFSLGKIGCKTGTSCGCSVGTYNCGGCSVPTSDLTLSYVNSIIGNGSTSLSFISAGLWESACTNRLQFQFRCTTTTIELRVIYFLSGSCPSGKSQYCSNLGSIPLNISLTSLNCSPLSITWTVSASGCPFIYGDGYTSFTLTYP